MKQKLLILIALIFTSMATWAATGQSRPSELFSKDGFSYCWSSEASHTLKLRDVDVSVTGSNVVVPSTVEYNGNTCTVITLAYCCFRDRSGIETITIPGSVKYIDYNAFHNCSVQKIIFEDNSASEMQIQYDNLDDDHGQFYYCSNLTEIYLGRSINGEYEGHPLSFEGQSHLKKVTFGPGITYIGKWLFKESAVTDLDFSNATGLTTIYNRSFMDCDALRVLDASGATSLASIKDEAFFDANILQTVKFPPSLTYIGDNSFDHRNLHDSVVDSVYFYGNDASADIACEDKDQGNLEYAKYVYLDRDVWISGTKVFPNCTKVDFGPHVTSIAGRCFEDAKITSLYIPSNIKRIGYKSFFDCGKLVILEIEGSSTPITFTTNDDNESGAFDSCESLVIARLGRNINYSTDAMKDNEYNWTGNMEISPFWDGYLQNVVIGDSVTEMLPYLFEDCNRMTSIVIGSGVKTIGAGVFKDCDKLNSITFAESKDPITIMPYGHCSYMLKDYSKLNPFDDCPLALFEMGRDIVDARGTGKRITNNDNAGKLGTLTVGKYVTKIPSNMFCDCTGIFTLDVSSDNVVVEAGAFDNCTSLKDLTFEGVATVQSGAFNKCTGLKSVSFMEAPVLSENVFQNCTAIDSVSVRYYSSPTTDAGYANTFEETVYSTATLVNIADDNGFKADFSNSLPWSKFLNRGVYQSTPVIDFSTTDEELPSAANVASISFGYDFEANKATAVLLPFNADSYYFGSDATIYSLATETEGNTLGAEVYSLKKLDLDAIETLPANQPLLVIVPRGETKVQAPINMFTEKLISFNPESYSKEESSWKVSADVQRDAADGTSNCIYTVADGMLKRINSADYTVPAYSFALTYLDGMNSLSLNDATTGDQILSNGFNVTPNQLLKGYATFYNESTDCEVVGVTADGNTVTPDVYTITMINGTTLTLHKVEDGVINKGQAVIVKALPGVEMHLRAVTSPSTDANAYAENMLKGVDVDTPVADLASGSDGFIYVLSGNTENKTNIGFYKYSTGKTLGAHKAYLDASVASNAKVLAITFEEVATGINNAEAKQTQGTVYDLEGRKLTEMHNNRVYVIDNKKIIKK